jgi:hypothetical protein
MSEHLCKNNRGRFGCQSVVTDNGAEESGYCESCYWPGIAEANQKYEELVQEGYSRVEAAELSGLNEGERHLGTVPITNVEQDEDDPEEEIEEDVTDRILTQIDEQNAAGDGLPPSV